MLFKQIRENPYFSIHTLVVIVNGRYCCTFCVRYIVLLPPSTGQKQPFPHFQFHQSLTKEGLDRMGEFSLRMCQRG